MRKLLRQELEGKLPSEPPSEIIAENRWLAGRYGMLAFFGDLSGGGRIDIQDYAGNLVNELAPDAEALGCESSLQHVLDIVRAGAGADRQVDLFRLLRLEGATPDEALRAVVDLVIRETKQQLD